jgi:hypothetical protein
MGNSFQGKQGPPDTGTLPATGGPGHRERPPPWFPDQGTRAGATAFATYTGPGGKKFPEYPRYPISPVRDQADRDRAGVTRAGCQLRKTPAKHCNASRCCSD